MSTQTIPLPDEHKEVLADKLDWEDFVWSDVALRVHTNGQQVGEFKPLTSYKCYDRK